MNYDPDIEMLLGPQTKPCYRCSGTGEVKCDVCHGTGRHWFSMVQDYRACRVCNGSGTRFCNQCHGSGEVAGIPQPPPLEPHVLRRKKEAEPPPETLRNFPAASDQNYLAVPSSHSRASELTLKGYRYDETILREIEDIRCRQDRERGWD